MGSVGFANPGHRFCVLNKDHQEVEQGGIGTLAIDFSQSPLAWFKGYGGNNLKSFVGHYYLTGDTVKLNELGRVDLWNV